MKIGLVWECPWTPSSYGKLALWTAYGLLKEGFSVRLYCPSMPEMSLYSRCVDYTVKCLHRTIGVCVDPGQPLEVCHSAAACNDRDVDVYIIGGTPFGRVESKWVEQCSHSQKPVAGYFVTETSIVQPMLAMWLAHVDAVAFPARAVAEAFLAHEPARELHKDWILAPHGLPDYYRTLTPDQILDYGLKAMDSGDAERLKPALESRSEGSLYGTIAKDHPRKDYAALLSAFALLKHKHPGRKLRLFLGLIKAVGAPMWNVDAIKATLGLADDDILTLEPRLQETGITELGLLFAYSLLNAYILATLGEGFGLPLVEAGSLGIPIVATRTPVIEELWEGYPLLAESKPIVVSEGFILYGTDYADLASKMEVLLDENSWEKCSKRAKATASRYTLDRMVEGVVKLAELAEKKKGAKKPHPLEKYDATPTPAYKEKVIKTLYPQAGTAKPKI